MLCVCDGDFWLKFTGAENFGMIFVSILDASNPEAGFVVTISQNSMDGSITCDLRPFDIISVILGRSESELFTGDTSKDNHSPGPVFREVSP